MGFGGKAANAAVMCARMGAKVGLIAKLGIDDNGKAYQEALKNEGIETKYVFTDPEGKYQSLAKELTNPDSEFES